MAQVDMKSMKPGVTKYKALHHQQAIILLLSALDFAFNHQICGRTEISDGLIQLKVKAGSRHTTTADAPLFLLFHNRVRLVNFSNRLRQSVGRG